MLRTPTSSAALFLVAILAGCESADEQKNTEDSTVACSGPTVTAGADAAVTLGGIASTSATATACEGDAVLSWTVELAPVDSAVDTTDLDVSDPLAPSFVPDVVGTYVLAVVATDATGAVSTPDNVVITVTSSNAAPTADCGENLTAEVDDRVDLDGSGSSDPEGAALEYAWTISSVPSCSALAPDAIFNGSTAAPSFVPDCEGAFVVALAVSDGTNWSAPDYCSVTVGTGDEPPIADAGDSSTLSPCTEEAFELNGFGSYDPEGAALAYSWSLLSAPSGSSGWFEDETLANPIFHWDAVGSYTFQLQVYDGVQWSAPDIVTYTFTDERDNTAPVANAGDDQTVSVTTDCETASYVFTCEDCPSEEVELDGSASDDAVDGDDLDFMWSDATGELTFTAQYSPTTTVYTPSFASTYNTTTTRTWDVELTVSDCADDDSDHVTITYTCTGEYSP